jgi:uncharacterized membrane protein
MLPDWSPNVHPLIVHFPIALLFVAALVDGIALVLRQRHAWMRASATGLYALAALGAAAALVTGRDASDHVALPLAAATTLNAHADWALYLVWFASLYTAARVAVLWRVPLPTLRVDAPLALLGLVSLLLVAQTAERGGELVYRYGVGVAAAAPGGADASAAEDAPLPATPALAGIRSLAGSPVRGDTLIVRQGQPAFVVRGDAVGDLEARARLDLSGFEGTAMLVHHVADAQNYDFLALTVSPGGPAQVRLGRVRGDAEEIFDSGTARLGNPVDVRAYAVGTHFRGYVGGEQVTHGHGDAAPAGPVGLRFDGRGVVRVLALGATAAE